MSRLGSRANGYPFRNQLIQKTKNAALVGTHSLITTSQVSVLVGGLLWVIWN